MKDDEEKKLWPWNPPTPYDEEPEDNYPVYKFWMDVFWTCMLVAAVSAGLMVLQEVFP